MNPQATERINTMFATKTTRTDLTPWIARDIQHTYGYPFSDPIDASDLDNGARQASTVLATLRTARELQTRMFAYHMPRNGGADLNLDNHAYEASLYLAMLRRPMSVTMP